MYPKDNMFSDGWMLVWVFVIVILVIIFLCYFICIWFTSLFYNCHTCQTSRNKCKCKKNPGDYI